MCRASGELFIGLLLASALPLWWCVAMAELAPSANCVTISYNATTNEKTYTVEGAWNPGSCYGQVLLVHTEFRDLLEAAGGGASAPDPSTSAFTVEEVASLKYQAANPSPFNLSLVDGALVGASVLAVWAVAVVFKTIAHQLQDHFSPSE